MTRNTLLNRLFPVFQVFRLGSNCSLFSSFGRRGMGTNLVTRPVRERNVFFLSPLLAVPRCSPSFSVRFFLLLLFSYSSSTFGVRLRRCSRSEKLCHVFFKQDDTHYSVVAAQWAFLGRFCRWRSGKLPRFSPFTSSTL